MVLNNNMALTQLSQITPCNTHDYLVYKGSHFLYLKDKSRFALAINLLEFINLIVWANAFYKQSKSKKRISVYIFYKALETLLQEQHFNTKTLKQYTKALKQVEQFKDAIAPFYIVDHFNIDPAITKALKA